MLFVMHRPGLVAVSGTITEIDGISVTVAGDVWLPVSKKTERRLCRLRFPRDFSKSNLKLKVGETIIAITEDDFPVEALFQDCETPDECYNLKAYSIRYSGVFDFEARGKTEEQHLFSGQVLESRILQMQNGSYKTVTKLHVRVAGQNEERLIVEAGEVKRAPGESCIVTTGKPVYGKSGIPYYPV